VVPGARMTLVEGIFERSQSGERKINLDVLTIPVYSQPEPQNNTFNMKKALILLAVATFSFALPSCKKCTTCTVSMAGISASSGETCGKKKDIDAAEKKCKDDAAAIGANCACSKS
jgi:hypothetical protein